MSSELMALQNQLLALSPNDRESLLRSIDYTERKSARALTVNEQNVFDGLMSLVDNPMSVDRLAKFYDIRRFEQRCEELETFVNSTQKFLRGPQKQELVRVCLRCLTEYLHGIGRPLTVKSVLDSMSLLAHAVDIAYPGYAKAQYLHKIVGSAEINKAA